MDDDVGPVLKGTAEIGRGEGVVHDERHAVGVSRFRETLDVKDVESGIGDSFAKERLGVGTKGGFEFFGAAVGRQKSELNALQAQINPHFLYNTLENIRYMCKLEPATAERMVFSLSKLLRYSLDGSREQVTLEEDLGHLNNYLSILEMRFGSRFEYKIDIAPECMQCLIPKLVLQPMIENSVKYGFGNQLNLHVELKAYIHEEKLMMICRDDGVGMSAAMVEKLCALMNQKEAPGRHSGLYNIHRRIQLLYGYPYGVEIRSLEGHGTTLVVTLPAVAEKNVHSVQGDNNDASGNDSGR